MSPPWTALAILTLARTSFALQFQSIASVSPGFVQDLNLSSADLGTLIGLYSLPGILLSFPGAALGRRFGDKRMVLLGMAGMILGGLLTAIARDFAWLAAGRVVSGAGGVLTNVILTKMVSDWFAGRRDIVLAMAIYINSFPIGVGIAMLALAPLGQAVGWSIAMVVTALIIAITLVFVAIAYAKHPNDLGGAAVSGSLSGRTIVMISLIGLIWAMFNGAFGVMVGFAPIFFAEIGVLPSVASVLVGATTWLLAVSGQVGGIIAHRWGRPHLLMLVGILSWGLCLLAMSLRAMPPAPAMVISGLLMGLPVGVILSLPSLVLRPENRGLGMGIFFTWLYVGLASAPPAAGWVRDATGMQGAALTTAACLVLGTLPLYALFRAGLRW